MFSQNITVYNRFGSAKAPQFSPFTIKNVHVEKGELFSAAARQYINGSGVNVIIPLSSAAGYLPQAAWLRLMPEQRKFYFTLCPGDIIANENAPAESGYIITSVAARGIGTAAHFAVAAGKRYIKEGSV